MTTATLPNKFCHQLNRFVIFQMAGKKIKAKKRTAQPIRKIQTNSNQEKLEPFSINPYYLTNPRTLPWLSPHTANKTTGSKSHRSQTIKIISRHQA